MNLNGRTINPGELRTRLKLYRRKMPEQTGGFRKPELVLIVTVWARWTNAHGNELTVAAAQGVMAPATVLMRYRNDVDATCVMEKDGKYWEIVGEPDNIQDRDEWMEIKVKAWRPG